MNNIGIIYCVRNPLFPHLVKIGQTIKETVEERGLNASNVPENFETVFANKVSNVKAVETAVHNGCADFRYVSKSQRATEFFYENAIERARSIVRPFTIEDELLNAELDIPEDVIPESYEPDPNTNDWISWEDVRLMRDENDRFRTEPDAKAGCNRAINFYRMSCVKAAKKVNMCKEGKISRNWLESQPSFKKLMTIQWADSEETSCR